MYQKKKGYKGEMRFAHFTSFYARRRMRCAYGHGCRVFFLNAGEVFRLISVSRISRGRGGSPGVATRQGSPGETDIPAPILAQSAVSP